MVTDFLLGALRGCLVLGMVAITLAVCVATIEIIAEGIDRVRDAMKKFDKSNNDGGTL